MKYLSFDTQFIQSIGFNYNHYFFNLLYYKVLDKELKIIISSVIDKEIISHLKEKVTNNYNDYKKVVSTLSKITDISFDKHNEEQIIDSAIKQYTKFKERFEIEVVNLDNVDANKIFNNYFNGKAPFCSGKKKNEFPDAFAIESILKYVGNNKLIIMSGDKDWIEALNKIENIKTYEKSVDGLKEIFDASESEVSILSSIIEFEEDIKEYVDESFDNSLDDIGSIYNDLTVESFSYKLHNIKKVTLIEYDEIEQKCKFVVHFNFDFQSDMRFDEVDYGYDGYFSIPFFGLVSGTETCSVIISSDINKINDTYKLVNINFEGFENGIYIDCSNMYSYENKYSEFEPSISWFCE